MATSVSGEGTVLAPTYYEGPFVIQDDVHIRRRYYTYRTEEGLVAGTTLSVMFTIDRPQREVWPYIKDFNLWQNPFTHFYSGVIGDLDGKTFALSLDRNDLGKHRYQVVRVIPEHVIAIYQPALEENSPYIPGLGGISPGFHVFMLNEHAGKTVVTILMEHASYASGDPDMRVEEALGPWRAGPGPEGVRKWHEDFIPELKRLVYDGT
jgi:hypothetical protein